MTKFTSVPQWLDSKPSTEELTKVLSMINRGETHRLRAELYDAERWQRKLLTSKKSLEALNISIPKDLAASIEVCKKKIEELKKQVPAVPKKLKPRPFAGDENAQTPEVKE